MSYNKRIAFKINSILFCVMGLLCNTSFSEGSLHISGTTKNYYFERLNENPFGYGLCQIYLGRSLVKQALYANLELGYDILVSSFHVRGTFTFGKPINFFGGEAHFKLLPINDEISFGIGPAMNYHTKFFSASIFNPIDLYFSRRRVEGSGVSYDELIRFNIALEFVIRVHLPLEE